MSSATFEISRPNTEALETLIRESEEIPTIPESLLQIMKVLDDQDSGPADLARAVRLDAPLMGKILRVANSPYYKNAGSISDINRCVAVLGYRTVRQMTLTISVATSLVAAVSAAGGSMDYRDLWQHSVVVGAMAKQIAAWVRYRDPEEVFTAGLMHDIGKFILEIRFAADYDTLVAARAGTGRSLVDLEAEQFGFDHAQIGEAFGCVWTLPDAMTQGIAGHHRIHSAGQGADEPAICHFVRLADYLANTMAPPRSDLGFDPAGIEPAQLCAAIGLRLPDLEKRLPELRDAVDLAADYLDID